jgi:aspartate aminotransferase-like enzyme
MNELLLLTPGPVQVPREVLEAGAAPMSHHNAPEFQAVFKPLLAGLRPIFGNDGPILVQNSSGRGAMEASLTNLFSPGDAVAMLVNGRFGLRFAGIARDLGLVVHPVGPEWGYAVSEAAIAETLTRHPEIKGLIGSMCETGTGVMNDLDVIGRMGERFGVITVVDAVSAAAGMPIEMTKRKLDVCFSGIQKCFMCPPGLALVATSNRVWDAIRASKHYRHYFNWVKMREWLELPKARMMGTPPESLVRSLAQAVAMMHEEGLPNVYARHALLAEAFHAFVHAAGCELVAKEPQYRSHTVSAMLLPVGIKAGDVVQRALKNDNVRLSAGQDTLKETAIRIGHMGPVRPDMLLRGVKALARALAELGMDAKQAQAGVDACAHVLARGEQKTAAA